MVKRTINLLIIFALLAKSLSSANFSISLNPGGIWALNGYYNETEKLKDRVIPGAGLGLGLRYEITENFTVEACYSYNWMFIKKTKRPDAYKDDKPAFVIPMYTLNGTVFLSTSKTMDPFLTAGVGIFPWSFSSQARGGELWSAPENPDEDFSKSSLGLNIGVGVEVYLWSKISLLIESKYYYIFAKDEEKFGTDTFTRQGLLGVRLGIAYHFGKRQSLENEGP